MADNASLKNLQEMQVKVARELMNASRGYSELNESIVAYDEAIEMWRGRVDTCAHIAKHHVGAEGAEDFNRLRKSALEMLDAIKEKRVAQAIQLKEVQVTYHKLKVVSDQFQRIFQRSDLDDLFRGISSLKNKSQNKEIMQSIGQDTSQRKMRELMFEAQALISLQEEKR